MGDGPQFDDVTMVAVKREAEQSTRRESPLDKLL
jgi:hypothetical protein